MKIVLPIESDYPDELFHIQLVEYRTACTLHYFKLNRLVRYFYWQRVKAAFALMPRQHWKRALDLGTGMGVLLLGLSSVAREVIGSDMSRVVHYTQAMLDKRGIRNVHLHFTDAVHLPFLPNTFDLIVCMSVIEHIPDPATALTEMRRVLDNDGVLIIGYPLEHNYFNFVRWLGIRLPARLKHRFCRGYKPTTGGPFHPHVSDYHSIDRSCEYVFQVDAQRNVGFMGIPLYRVLRLVKRQSSEDTCADGVT